MGRNKIAIAPEAQTQDLIAQDQQKQALKAQETYKVFGFDGMEYDHFIYKETVRKLLEISAWSGTEAGKGLIVIKENENHGVFMKDIADIGFSYRTAARYMHNARRYGKCANLAHLNDSKLSVLDELTDPELEKFLAGDEVKGLTLDVFDEMPATELRKRLRAAEEKLKNQKIHYKDEIGKLKDEIERLKEITDYGSELTSKEKKAKAVNATLEELRKELFAYINTTRENFKLALNTIAKAKQLEDVTFPQLEHWARSEYEELAGFNELFEELDEELNIFSVGKVNAK